MFHIKEACENVPVGKRNDVGREMVINYVEGDQIDAVKYVIEDLKINTNWCGYWFLDAALETKAEKCGKYFVGLGLKTDGSFVEEYSRTILQDEVLRSNVDKVTLLLNWGSNPNERSRHGDVPLDFAVCAENEEMVKLLIRHGAKVELSEKVWAKKLNVLTMSDCHVVCCRERITQRQTHPEMLKYAILTSCHRLNSDCFKQ